MPTPPLVCNTSCRLKGETDSERERSGKHSAASNTVKQCTFFCNKRKKIRGRGNTYLILFTYLCNISLTYIKIHIKNNHHGGQRLSNNCPPTLKTQSSWKISKPPSSKYSSSRPQPPSQMVLAPPVSFSPSSASSSAGFQSSTGFSGCSASSSPLSVCLEHLAVWPSLVSSSPSSASSSSSPSSEPLQRCSKLDWNTVYHDFNRFPVGMFSHALQAQ